MKRKKRLKKGIESLERQIKIHEEKLKEAADYGDDELVHYYERELKSLESEEIKKRKQLGGKKK